VRIVHPNLPFFNAAKSISQLCIATTHGFHLSTLQHYTSLKTSPHKIIVMGFAVSNFLKTVVS
jgi:hypothetical protein